MAMETVSPYRPDTSSILTVRALFSHRFRLPIEITDQVLDYAHYWLSTLTVCSDLPLSHCHSSRSLVETPPFGSTHSESVDVGSEERAASVRMRGKMSCREIRMSLHVRGVKRLRSRDFWTPPRAGKRSASDRELYTAHVRAGAWLKTLCDYPREGYYSERRGCESMGV